MKRLLDLCCKAGGTARGYDLAGFDEIVGVDIEPQPNFPYEFHQGDAMTFPLDGFDVVHASPPCQDHTSMQSMTRDLHGTGWMLAAMVERLTEWGGVFVVENVGGSSRAMGGQWTVLCGSMFGLEVRRHRLFRSSSLLLAPSCAHHLQPEPIDVTGTGGPGGRHRKPTSLAHAREAMGIDWMTRKELSQAIPPAYTRFIGEQLLQIVAV